MTSVEFYHSVLSALDSQVPSWLVTVVASDCSTPQKPGAKMLVRSDGQHSGTIGGGDVEFKVVQRVLSLAPEDPELIEFDLAGDPADPATPHMNCGGAMSFFVEPLVSVHQLIIFGGGHCAIELSALAAKVGFAVTVVDHREEWASREKHSSAVRTLCIPFEELEKHIAFTPQTYIVVMTHGHAFDEQVVRLCLPHEFKYIGMLGSPKKVRIVRENLEASGFSPEIISRLRAPVGVPIGSHTPAEIAVSIAAELIAVAKGVTV